MTTITQTQKIAFYYGWPSAVNGSAGDTDAAAAVFKDYDIVVFGAGLEDASHGDHANTTTIINHADMVNTKVFGYVDAVPCPCENEDNIDNWLAMGVAGIFCDQFGYDFGLTRVRQNALVKYIHSKSLDAFVNAWNPDDVFDNAAGANNPGGIAHKLVATDYYLAESYQIINGAYQNATDWKTKSDKMAAYKTAVGCHMSCVTTASAFDQAKADYSYLSCVLYNFDSWGWGEEFFSASSATLPFRTRATFDGTEFTGVISSVGDIVERQTNTGIVIDTLNHTVGNVLQ